VILPEPPRNSGYMVAAYSITAIILLSYWTRLWRAARKADQSVLRRR
jgi:hypothetical protein